MDPLDALYAQIAAGEAPPPRDYLAFTRLLSRARHAGRSADETERLAAVAVAGAIGGHWGMGVVREFSRDPALGVRRAALRAALAEGEGGLGVLRDLLLDPDEALALEALSWLQRAADKGSTSRLRQLLGSASPALRAGAAALLGHVAGPGMIVALKPLLQDGDPGVSAAAAEAIERLEGRKEKAQPEAWWVRPDAAWTPPEAVPLPEPLPEETAALFALLGQVAPEGRGAVLAALRGHSDAALREALRGCQPDRDRALNVGGARAAAGLNRQDWAIPIRRLLLDHDPGVRIAAAESLGEIGGATVVMSLRDALSDAHPPVRLAAARALGRLLTARELPYYLGPLLKDPDETVRAAAAALLAPTPPPAPATPEPG